MLKKLVEIQLVCSSEQEVESYKEKLLEMKMVKVSNFLDMLRSTSSDDIFLLLLNTCFILIG
ncbi:hypothetical protein AHAS_Ahas16G0128200 [Arachis hypogaea]